MRNHMISKGVFLCVLVLLPLWEAEAKGLEGLREIEDVQIESGSSIFSLKLNMRGSGKTAMEPVAFKGNYIQLQVSGC